MEYENRTAGIICMKDRTEKRKMIFTIKNMVFFSGFQIRENSILDYGFIIRIADQKIFVQSFAHMFSLFLSSARLVPDPDPVRVVKSLRCIDRN